MDGQMSSVSEPVSVDDLEAILRDWNIEDGDQVLSVSSSRPGGGVSNAVAAVVNADSDIEANQGVDVDSWASELMGQLSNCQSDPAMANEVIKQFLKAFETQATAAVGQHRKSLANANRILLKTLQRIHHNHKQLREQLPLVQKQAQDAERRAEVAESRCKVLELHLQRAMDSEGAHGNNRFSHNL